MKKKLILATVILTTAISVLPMQAFAAINDAEQRILNVIAGTYTYNGKNYKVKESYQAKVRAKFDEEGFDMTDAEADNYITLFYNNLGQGIAQGYMEEVAGESGGKKKKPADNNTENNNEGASNDNNAQEGGNGDSQGGNDNNGQVTATQEATAVSEPAEVAAPKAEEPTIAPTEVPTEEPTKEPTKEPTETPTKAPTEQPTATPTKEPTEAPTSEPTEAPTVEPTEEAVQDEETAEDTEAQNDGTEDKKDKKDNTKTIAIVGGVVILGLLGVVIALVLKKK